MNLKKFIDWMNSPLKISVAGSGLLFFGFGIVDFQRHVTLENKHYVKKKSFHLDEAMENLHDLASKHTLRFSNIIANSRYCDESYYIFECANKKKHELQHDFKMSPEEAEETVASEYHGFVQRISRRALIRNGHLVKWVKAVTQDEFFKVFILPIVGFFVVRAIKLSKPPTSGVSTTPPSS